MRALALLLVLLSGCTTAVQDAVVKHQLAKAQDMLRADGVSLDHVRGPVWSFQYGWYRNLVLSTHGKFAVVDPMSEEAARALAQAIDGPVEWMAYSHAHLDHIRGGAALSPASTFAHAHVARELDLLDRPAEVVFPTETVEEDHAFTWEGIRIEMLHLPRSHSDSYLATWLPEERVLYAPDLVAKKGGLALENDAFLPGVLKAQERLIALDADLIVPGHYAICTNADLVRHHAMLKRMRDVTLEEIAREKTFDATKMDPDTFIRIQKRLRKEFGDVEGFDDALITNTYYLVLGAIGGF